MQRTLSPSSRPRLRATPLDPTTERMANELRGFLVADHPGNRWHQASASDRVLRENIRHGNVRVCEHFVTACKYSGARAKIIALILALTDEGCADTTSDVDVSLNEQCAQSRTDPLQHQWATGQFQTPRQYFELGEGLNVEIAAATTMRDRVLTEAARLIGLSGDAGRSL